MVLGFFKIGSYKSSATTPMAIHGLASFMDNCNLCLLQESTGIAKALKGMVHVPKLAVGIWRNP